MANQVVFGAERVSATMRAKRKSEVVYVEYTVSYEAPYAIHVHENLTMKLRGQARPSGRGKYWDARSRPGTSKYLEIPVRKMQGKGGTIIATLMRRGLSLAQATFYTARMLLAESRKIVPFEFGALWKSGRVRRVKQIGGGGGASSGPGKFGPW